MTSTATFSYQELLQRRTQQASVLLTPDIYDWYRHMQKEHTVHFDAERASWLVFRYDDVHRVLLDTTTFSSQRTVNPDGSIDPIASGGILGMDPPRHRQLRALISQAFTPRVVALLEPRITSIVHILLDRVQDKGEMDIVVDIVFAGQEIKAGSLLLPLFASANLDEAQFPNADHFDIQRTPNRHLGFGYGIHFCLGAPLARLETRIALKALLERFPNLERIRTTPLELKPSSFIYGIKHIPITLR